MSAWLIGQKVTGDGSQSLDIFGRISTVFPVTIQVQQTAFIEFLATTPFTQTRLKSPSFEFIQWAIVQR
jgi:hypothetical protein